jgi:large subunit ribosomal protein L37Ae
LPLRPARAPRPRVVCPLQGKRTRKVGICGKYGTRYGATLRKLVKKIEISQHAKVCSKRGGGGPVGASACAPPVPPATRARLHARLAAPAVSRLVCVQYNCVFCGRDSIRRTAAGIWECRGCHKVIAGGAYQLAYVPQPVRADARAHARKQPRAFLAFASLSDCACVPAERRGAGWGAVPVVTGRVFAWSAGRGCHAGSPAVAVCFCCCCCCRTPAATTVRSNIVRIRKAVADGTN